MVKWPVVVPSPLSWKVSGVFVSGGLFLGADQLVLVGVDDCLVGFDGLDRPPGEPAELVGAEPLGLLHQASSTCWRCVLADTRAGSCRPACTITAACPGETRPASRAAAVASWPPDSSCGGERDLAGRLWCGRWWSVGDPGLGAGEPGIRRGTGLVGGGDHLELQRLDPAGGPVQRRRPRGAVLAANGARRRRASGPGHLASRPHPRAPGGRFRGGGRGALPWVNSLSNKCSSQEESESVDNLRPGFHLRRLSVIRVFICDASSRRTTGRNHNGRVKRQ